MKEHNIYLRGKEKAIIQSASTLQPEVLLEVKSADGNSLVQVQLDRDQLKISDGSGNLIYETIINYSVPLTKDELQNIKMSEENSYMFTASNSPIGTSINCKCGASIIPGVYVCQRTDCNNAGSKK